MKLSRLLGAACLVLLAQGAAATEDYPARPVKIVVGFPPGSGSDISARQLADRLSRNLKATFYVDNKAGNGGALGAESVARAVPDGYTLLASSSGPLVLAPLINKSVKLDLLRDFIPVALTGSSPYILVVKADAPFNTLKDFIAAAQGRPGKMSYASSGIGVTNHLLMEMFKEQTRTFMVHVPYRGSAGGLTDVAAGQVEVMFDVWAAVEPLVKAGKLRPLAIASAHRDPSLPDIPTMTEAGLPGFRGEAWGAILAPANTPPAVVTKLHAEINKILGSSDWQAFVRAAGGASAPSSQQEMGSFIRAEVARWGQVVKRTKVQVD